MEPEGSLPCWQETFTGPYPEPDQSSPYQLITFLQHPSYGKDTKLKTKLNTVALVRERTIPTERPPLVREVSANFCV
jgi:hypothetical protein